MIHVLCLQETRWKVSKAREIGDGIKLFYHGFETRRNGVAIAIAGPLKEHVSSVNRISDRIISLRIATEDGFWTVVSVYAPQCGCTEADKEAFYDELDDVIRSAPEGDYITIAGDFNGHVGQDRGGSERVHGGRGFGKRNQEGERIIELAEAHDLAIASTFFIKRESQKITYCSGGRQSEIDHILVKIHKWQTALADEGLKLNLKETEVMRSIGGGDAVLDVNGTAFAQTEEFQYLGNTLSADGTVDAAIRGRIACAWLNWRESTGILCDVLKVLEGAEREDLSHRCEAGNDVRQ
ncbi:hypothetical protein ANCCEY_12338 [Ancylostoma ceylanicum]|uniref:Endonuclease/exonuclease/phosphatase domain-containing protein n=1 Tax=Ancylostoma ceylanicum TaxID=53326 RepID=A0A0D6LBF1_9BILA|nr:hypothetical protein ANCCEY_12338 [Ancylostoma ceylanicum]